MAGSVNHRARRREIIRRSIGLFARVGYKDVTFQMLAENSGLARTVIYRYFKNKRRIFDAAILEVMKGISDKHREVVLSRESAAVRLRQICTAVTATLFDNREFLAVIVDFVMTMKRTGRDVSRRVPQFTDGLKRILRTLLQEGVRRGEFREDINIERHVRVIYAQFESAVLRLTVTEDAAMSEVLDQIECILEGIRNR